MDIRLDGKIALVTGAASGIGQAIAFTLAECGAKVAVNYHGDPDAAAETMKRIIAAGGDTIGIRADVADPAQVAAMFAQIDGSWGPLDILVNCAGTGGEPELSWKANIADWRRIIEVNLFGAFYCAQQALARMTARKSGVILNITSVHESIAWTGYSAYCASKAGLSMLSKTMAQEAAPFGVRVLSLAPGAICIEKNKDIWNDPAKRPDMLEKIPLARVGQVEDVSRMAAVLVSDVSSYITGTTIFVDGGMTDYPGFTHGG